MKAFKEFEFLDNLEELEMNINQLEDIKSLDKIKLSYNLKKLFQLLED